MVHSNLSRNKIKILYIHSFYRTNSLNGGIFIKRILADFSDNFILSEYSCVNRIRFLLKCIFDQKFFNKFDIIHVQYGSLDGLLSVLIWNRRKVLSIRGSDWTQSNNLSFHQTIAKFFTLLSLPFYKKIITVSRRLEIGVSKYLRENQKTYVLPDPIDNQTIEIIQKLKNFPEKLKNNNLISKKSKPFHIGFVAENIESYVKRYSLARETIDYCNLKIALPGRPLVLNSLTNLKNIELLKKLSSMNMLISTSASEGWPNCVKEAMLLGLPVVATNISDLYELSRSYDGIKIAKSDSIEELCECINYFYKTKHTLKYDFSKLIEECKIDKVKNSEYLIRIYNSFYEND